MVKKVYTKEQKAFLLRNRNVDKCGKDWKNILSQLILFAWLAIIKHQIQEFGMKEQGNIISIYEDLNIYLL